MMRLQNRPELVGDRPAFPPLTHVALCPQSQERGGPSGPSSDVNRARELLTAARHRRDARALPKDEEDYFNEVCCAPSNTAFGIMHVSARQPVTMPTSPNVCPDASAL